MPSGSSQVDLVLGSGSPRRRDFLASLGLSFEVRPAEVDESTLAAEAPDAYLTRICVLKLDAVMATTGDALVLVADTSVIVDGDVLGKPRDADDNAAMIRRLAGRAHEVSTRFALGRAGACLHAETVTTEVVFRPLSDALIARYVRSGEGSDKAGGYAIQGFGAWLVAQIRGSASNVVGLPMCEVVRALEALGRFP